VRQFQRPSAGRNHVFYPALSGRLAVGNFKSRQDKDNVHCMALCQGKSRQVLVNSYSDVPYLAGVGGSFINDLWLGLLMLVRCASLADGTLKVSGVYLIMTRTVNVDEAKNQLQDLLVLALEGNDEIITAGGKPLARLVPVAASKRKRVAGLNRGKIWASEDFDEPLPDEFWVGHE